MRGKLRTWTDAQFVAAVAAHTNFTDVIRSLGLRPAGGNHRSMKKHAARLGVATNHFNNERRVRGLRLSHERVRLPLSAVFCEGSHVLGHCLRRYVRRHFPPSRCALCGLTDHWNGMPLTLQLDHVNGTYNDNRIDNLRWLCPNCHSQTAGFAGRGRHRNRTLNGLEHA